MANTIPAPDTEGVNLREILLDGYVLSRQIGKGKYSVVFECADPLKNQRFALKVFRKTKQAKIRREIDILKHLAGGPNIISFVDIVEDFEDLTRGLVLELVDYTDFRSLFPRFRDREIRHYVSELLKALEFCHSKGVMHRDVRPHNVVIDHAAKKLRLVGWGSSVLYDPEKNHTVRVSVFKAPELLLDYQRYDYSLDMWGLGSMVASMVFRKEPFFHGCSTSDQLVRISRVLGTDKLFEYVDKYGIELDREHVQLLDYVPPQPWTSFVTPENARTANAEAIDFVDNLVRFDHRDRLTAEQALRHPYFRPILGRAD